MLLVEEPCAGLLGTGPVSQALRPCASRSRGVRRPRRPGMVETPCSAGSARRAVRRRQNNRRGCSTIASSPSRCCAGRTTSRCGGSVTPPSSRPQPRRTRERHRRRREPAEAAGCRRGPRRPTRAPELRYAPVQPLDLRDSPPPSTMQSGSSTLTTLGQGARQSERSSAPAWLPPPHRRPRRSPPRCSSVRPLPQVVRGHPRSGKPTLDAAVSGRNNTPGSRSLVVAGSGQRVVAPLSGDRVGRRPAAARRRPRPRRRPRSRGSRRTPPRTGGRAVERLGQGEAVGVVGQRSGRPSSALQVLTQRAIVEARRVGVLDPSPSPARSRPACRAPTRQRRAARPVRARDERRRIAVQRSVVVVPWASAGAVGVRTSIGAEDDALDLRAPEVDPDARLVSAHPSLLLPVFRSSRSPAFSSPRHRSRRAGSLRTRRRGTPVCTTRAARATPPCNPVRRSTRCCVSSDKRRGFEERDLADQPVAHHGNRRPSPPEPSRRTRSAPAARGSASPAVRGR